MHVIALASRKGGVGKSTLAMHLAHGLSFKSQVALVDTDPQGSSMHWSLVAVDNKAAFPFRVLHYRRKSSTNPKEKEVDLGTFIEREVPPDTEYLVLDCPAGAEDRTTQEALLLSQLVLIPTTPAFLDLAATTQTSGLAEKIADLRRMKKLHFDYYMVLNKITGKSGGQTQSLAEAEALGIPLLDTRLKHRSAITDGPTLGKTVFSPGLRGEARNEMTRFVAEVKRKLRGK